ncbi:Ubiquinone/menaquinone biosynthesis C-methyltransferase UbiE [Madurella mycetomatis]|uniref:Ubiquinone/menaquinone biosynthesis C-methyltransferase UbiE n=1 Tax=Madurella mycetomatis TaxID=100816 RepID=A0A175WBU3_9PEZI|nr:Ubiquinone/menaquinone biosynthesis C-methyltransferase UbiE [Madurella mycetomatis]
MATREDQPKTAIEHFNAAAEHYGKFTGGCTRELALSLLELPQLADAGTPGSIVLDNACGTAIVSEEVIRRHGSVGSAAANAATIYIVDAAPNMVEISRRKLEGLNEGRRYNITGHVMPGEHLDFGDGTFTHSITNLGILFYVDGLAGAKEIYRTLRAGGVAVVTSWIDLGYFDPIVKAAQLEIRPNEPPHQLPLSPEWLAPSHLESILSQGGFSDVKVSPVKVHYGADTVERIVDLLAHAFRAIWKDWPDDDKTRFRVLVHEKTAQVAEQYTMPNGKPGVGIPMTASVAVCRK